MGREVIWALCMHWRAAGHQPVVAAQMCKKCQFYEDHHSDAMLGRTESKKSSILNTEHALFHWLQLAAVTPLASYLLK